MTTDDLSEAMASTGNQGASSFVAAGDPLAGTPFRSLAILGGGSMGEVIEAEHIALRRRVVVKIMRRQLGDSTDFDDRVRLEAQTLAAIMPHPHVVSVIDLGRTGDGRPYFAMERLNGCTLQQELARREFLPVAEAVAFTRQLLDGLSAAHKVGVIHRDIKPGNLFLCDANAGERILKILDFGIAKVVSGGSGLAPNPLVQPTAEGFTLGTPRFLSPEQARGQAVDHRADLYSTGIVLYAMLAGRGPFHDHSGVFSILVAQADELPRPPSSIAKQTIPEGIERVVMKALEKLPGDRFSSAVEFSEALARAATGRSAGPWPRTERVNVGVFRPVAPAHSSGARAAGAVTGGETTEPIPVDRPRVGPSLPEPAPIEVRRPPEFLPTEPVNLDQFRFLGASAPKIESTDPVDVAQLRPRALPVEVASADRAPWFPPTEPVDVDLFRPFRPEAQAAEAVTLRRPQGVPQGEPVNVSLFRPDGSSNNTRNLGTDTPVARRAAPRLVWGLAAFFFVVALVVWLIAFASWLR